MEGRFVAYYRVSTKRQGASGLGLEAQQETVRQFLNGGAWDVVGEFKEVEHATVRNGKSMARPELDRALQRCRVTGATLVVAKVDRLTRNPDFITKLVEAGVMVAFCDLPKVEGPVGKFMLRQMLSVAELEAGLISERTKKALAAAKARGVKLGGDRGNLGLMAGDTGLTVREKASANSIAVRGARADQRAKDLAGTVAELRAAGAVSLRQLAAGLNHEKITTPRGGEWSATQVRSLLARIE